MNELQKQLASQAEQQANSTSTALPNQHLGIMRVPQTKNYNAAEIQITAEQLLRESQLYKTDESQTFQQVIRDSDELDEYKYRTRKEFEDSIRKQRHHMGTWIKYAEWEASIAEFDRARSVFERTVDVDFEHVTLWLKYAEMEMKNKFINHARNVWERACKHLPRVDQFWYKYSYMEEMVGEFDRARKIFEDWMTWEPQENAWNAYLKFEERQGQLDKCRTILERYIDVNPTVSSYIKAAKFEEQHRSKDQARLFYERALAELGPKAFDENFFIQFTNFEIRFHEHERAKILYKYALDNLPKERANRLYQQFLEFEKQYGSREEMEDVILTKRRHFLEAEIAKQQQASSGNQVYDYDLWFDYTRLEEQSGSIERAREIYERALQNVPPVLEKRYWKRYVYLWINYAVFEELQALNIERAQAIYEKLLFEMIPHERFIFSKLWIMFAQFLLRQKNLDRCRKVLGQSMGKCPKQKIFKAYAQIEMQLGQLDRCRTIYNKQIEIFSQNSSVWIDYADFESQLDEVDRAREIYELAISNHNLDMPEKVWQSYLDFEISLGDFDKVRSLYQRLLSKSKHLKVWLSYSKFESENAQDPDKARKIFFQAYNHFKTTEPDLKEERLMILENWLRFEEGPLGDMTQLEQVRAKIPKKVKKRRKVKVINQETGEEVNDQEGGWEEYYDYLFPDDAMEQKKSLKILEMAHKWKKDTATTTAPLKK
eukprot:403368491